MIKFDNWVLTSTSRSLDGYQYDNLTVELEVVGDFPAGWDWKMLVQFEDNVDVLPLTFTDNGIGCVLNKDNLCFDGCYSFQLQGAQGDLIKHTNIIYLYLPKSISGDAQWPTIPTAFTEMERRMTDMAMHPPIPGENGCWMLWDTAAGKYVASDIPLPEGTGEGGGGGGGTPNAVQYVPQALTEAQQTQARKNIGAFGEPELQGGIDQALEQAKESGAFDGAPGAPGKDGKDGLPTVAAVPGAEVSLTMESNVAYHCAETVTALTIEGFTPAGEGKASIWAVQFKAGESITVSLPDTVKWSVAQPVFTPGVSYWLSFVPLLDGILGVWVSDES